MTLTAFALPAAAALLLLALFAALPDLRRCALPAPARERFTAAEGIFLALERFGAKPENALYTGDSTTDAEAARNAGVAFCGVTHGVTSAEELAAYPHQAIGDTLETAAKLIKI